MVNLKLEISKQYHDNVKGRNGENILKIMDQTNTKVSSFENSSKNKNSKCSLKCSSMQINFILFLSKQWILFKRLKIIGYFVLKK